jgi:hypothetical protein
MNYLIGTLLVSLFGLLLLCFNLLLLSTCLNDIVKYSPDLLHIMIAILQYKFSEMCYLPLMLEAIQKIVMVFNDLIALSVYLFKFLLGLIEACVQFLDLYN